METQLSIAQDGTTATVQFVDSGASVEGPNDAQGQPVVPLVFSTDTGIIRVGDGQKTGVGQWVFPLIPMQTGASDSVVQFGVNPVENGELDEYGRIIIYIDALPALPTEYKAVEGPSGLQVELA